LSGLDGLMPPVFVASMFGMDN